MRPVARPRLHQVLHHRVTLAFQMLACLVLREAVRLSWCLSLSVPRGSEALAPDLAVEQ